MRIGFLFNHSAAHQVAHSLPVAAAIAALHPQVELSLLVTGGAAEAEVRRLWAAAGHAPDDPRIIRLDAASLPARWLTRLSGNAIPMDRVSILKLNLATFRSLDALVVPEKTSTMLKTRFGLDRLALIHTRHGAGDRAIGFDKASARFDLVLMSGRKILERLEAAGLLKPDGHAIIGYPKFDNDAGQPFKPLFDNERPTVLYNPHPSPALSSWYKMGPEVVRWFARQDKFNLALAPHVMLFARRRTIALSPLSLAQVPDVPAVAMDCPHIWVDKGSRASIDMTYTNGADIYLGDASSQVYEFIRRPRPCIFLNPHRHAWEGDPDFAHWQAGPVVNDIAGMTRALDAALAQPHAFKIVQQRLFAHSFDIDDRPSAYRAADAIIRWLEGQRGSKK